MKTLIYRGASEARRNCVTQTEATALEQNSQIEMRSDNAAAQLAHAQSERKECANAQSERKEVPVKAEAPKIPVLSPDEGYAYFEGQIVPMSEAKVSVATHALHYGTACFEGIRGYWNEQQQQLYLLKLREHYERMADSWNVIRMKPNESIDDLCRITIELVKKHGYHQDVYVRPLAYKASRTIKLTLSALDDAITIYTFAMGNYLDISVGLSVCTSSWRRANSNAMPVRAKVGMVVEERRIDRTELYSADEIFMCGTGVQVSPVTSVDHRPVRSGKPGPMTMKLQELSLSACRGENEKYKDW